MDGASYVNGLSAETYWANLSLMEKTLLWLGFVTFYITLVSGIGWKVVTVFGQTVMDTMTRTPNLLEPTARVP
jgi:hypothetical protein